MGYKKVKEKESQRESEGNKKITAENFVSLIITIFIGLKK